MAYRDSNPFGFTLTRWVKRLLVANGALFLLTLALPTVAVYLRFVPAEVLSRPWTVLTYMFVHAGFWHLLFNMLGLLFFGPPLEERWGSGEFLKFYLVCGLAGALASVAFPYTPIVGASAAVYGVLVAFAVLWPESMIYIWGILPVKAKWLVSFLVGMSVFYTLTGAQSGVAHLAHLGGAVAAFAYLKSPLAPSLWGETYGTTRRKKRRPFAFLRRRLRAEPVEASEPPRRAPATKPQRSGEDDVDRILDKIAQSGLQSLTPEERRRLEDASRRLRTN